MAKQPEQKIVLDDEDRIERIEYGETNKGKKIQLKRTPDTCLWYVEFESGGKIPEELSGHFTSAYYAQQKVDAYLNRK